MRLFAESTFDVDNSLKDWLEQAGPAVVTVPEVVAFWIRGDKIAGP
jgi:hypothetical protein